MGKNILIILNSSDVGGAEIVTLNNLKSFSSENNYYLCLFKKGKLNSQFSSNVKKIFYFNRFNFFKLIRFIRQNNVDIIHSNLFHSDILSFFLSFFLKKKYISTRHNNKIVTNNFLNWSLEIINKFLYSFHFDQVISVSKGNYDFLLKNKLINVLKLKLVENGVFIKSNYVPCLINSKELHLGIVARLSFEKNHNFLFMLLDNMINFNNFNNIYLHVFGDGPFKNELISLAKKLNLKNQIIFHGLVLNKDLIYSKFDVLCAPSYYESFGLSLVESMSYGKPVIVSDLDVFKRIFSNGVEGYLVNCDNFEEFSEKILFFKENSDKYFELSKNAFNRSKNFDILKKVVDLEEIYLNL